MATRRMFSLKVIEMDEFMDLPISAQNLYFFLGMYSDDDGFVSPRKVIRLVNANPDDLKILLAKGFIIQFASGIVVVTHWNENNKIQSDRRTSTVYQKEFEQLERIQNVYNLIPQDRLEQKKQERLEEAKKEEARLEDNPWKGKKFSFEK